MKLSWKVTVAALLGIVAGIFFPSFSLYMKRGAEIFTNLINMIVVLLVLATVSLGIVKLQTPQRLGKVAGRTCILFLFLTLTSLFIGMGLAYVFDLGSALHFNAENLTKIEIPSVGDLVLSWIPINPLAAIAQGNIIQIVVFSIFLGISILAAGPKGRPVIEALESLSDAMQQMTAIVLNLVPYGIFMTVGYAVSLFTDTSWTLTALYFLLTYALGVGIIIFGLYASILWYRWNLNPKRLLVGMRDALVVAFATSSSTATLPVTLHCLTQNLGIAREIASFIAPLGAMLNKNGLALFHGMGAVFVAQAYGIPLGIEGYTAVILSGALTSFATGAIPGAGLMQLFAVFNTVGLPLEGIAVIAVFDSIREMLSSMLNVLGDAVAAAGVARQVDCLDERIYRRLPNEEWESSLV